ncbi:MAG: type IV pilin [archaeon]
MKPTTKSDSDDRAVSPVIGVILMVAITVILAAVIGTFVLGLGDQLGDSAPQASFSTDNVVNDSEDGNLTFDIEKTGGQDVNPDDITVIANGTRIGSVSDEGGVSNPWQTGSTASFEEGTGSYNADDVVEISLVHDPSGDTMYQTEKTVRSS